MPPGLPSSSSPGEDGTGVSEVEAGVSNTIGVIMEVFCRFTVHLKK
jgi:hypothetical protein